MEMIDEDEVGEALDILETLLILRVDFDDPFSAFTSRGLDWGPFGFGEGRVDDTYWLVADWLHVTISGFVWCSVLGHWTGEPFYSIL